ncbi:hypothetical protein ACP3W1_23620, partial [Salmonella enterica]
PLSCFDLQDWRTLQVDEAERDWQALRDWRAHECMGVERGQVFLLGLVRMPGGEDRLWLSLDLLAADVESLRLLLAEREGVPPQSLRYAAGAHGKPRLQGEGRCSFSLSYAAQQALIASADGTEIGVDVTRL